MKTIAVLLAVHNRKDKTLGCLQTLFSQELSEGYLFEVFLTDDGCTDGTSEAVRTHFPEVNIIKGDGNLFWNRGMWTAWNYAATKYDYDFYLWLNDDTFIYPDCLSRLIAQSNYHNDKAIIVGSTSAVSNPDIITYGGFQNGKLIKNVDHSQWCDAINGNIVLVPKYVYNILGTNDPYFRHAAGDTDYGLRAKENNVGCYIGSGIFGECDLHERPTVWMDPSLPFMKRWKNFFSPTGNNPIEFFYFKKKHYGTIAACIVFVSMWTHFFFPWFWPHCYKK